MWFPKEATRYVDYEITVRNRLYKVRDQTYKISACYHYPDGYQGTHGPFEWRLMSSDAQSWYANGRGSEILGIWKPGVYRVEIFIDGIKLTEGAFAIE